MKTFTLTVEQTDAIVVAELQSYLDAMRDTKSRLEDALARHGDLPEFERSDLGEAYRVVAALEIVLDSYRVRGCFRAS